MSLFSGFAVVFSVGMGGMILFIIAISYLIRTAKYGSWLGSMAETIAGGHIIVEKAGNGSVAMLMNFLKHEQTGKYALKLNYVQGFRQEQTPYVYEAEDFMPKPDDLIANWDNFAGTIICYRGFDGKGDYRDAAVKNISEGLKHFRKLCASYQRLAAESIGILEGEKLQAGKDTILNDRVKLLSNMKQILEERNVEEGATGQNTEEVF